MIFGRLPLPGIFQSCWIIKLIHVILPSSLSLLMSVLWHLQSCIRKKFSGREAFWSLLYIILGSGNTSLFLERVRQNKNSLSGSVETRGDDLLCAHCVCVSLKMQTCQMSRVVPISLGCLIPQGIGCLCQKMDVHSQIHNISSSAQQCSLWAWQFLVFWTSCLQLLGLLVWPLKPSL